jgi:hypothetical protein
MPKFNAESIGGELEYDLSKWGGPKGVVPEPPRHAVNKLMKDVTTAFKESGLGPETADGEVLSPEQVADTMNKVEDEEMFGKLTDLLVDALADLCGGSPSREALENLPYRPFMGFFGYLIGNLTNPEVSAPDTNSSRRLRSV